MVKRDARIKREPNGCIECHQHDKMSKRHAFLKSIMDNDMARKCLMMQNILIGVNQEVINQIMNDGTIVRYKRGQVVTKQGDSGEATFFILKGLLDVLVNNRKVAERKAKECVGEMSVLDPTQNRCATLVAAEDTHLLQIPSKSMEQLLSENLSIVRNVAIELCSRLRERSRYHESPNSLPRIFIGSSLEGLPIAKNISKKLEGVETKLWNKDVFNPSESNIEALVTQARSSDFAA